MNKQTAWDLEPVAAASFNDLDQELVTLIVQQQRSLYPFILAGDDVSVLRKLHILAPATGDNEQQTGQPIPTLGGLLALGSYPQFFFPQLTVTCVAYAGTSKAGKIGGIRYFDNAFLVGPIPQLIADAVSFVAKNMRTGAEIKNGVRHDLPDYPLDVVREAVTNALMHRDYSPAARGAQVQVNLYIDRLEIQSPGGLFGTVTVQRLGQDGVSDSRNQHLARILELTPYEHMGTVVENRGTGYQTMLDMLAAARMPAPIPHDNLNFFRLTFPQRNPTPAEQQATEGRPARIRILEHLNTVETASARDLAAAAGLSLGGTRRVVNELLELGIIARTAPTRSPKQRYRIVRGEG